MARGILNAIHTQGKIPLIQSNRLTDQKGELVLSRKVLFDDLGGLAYIALKLHFGQIQPNVQVLVLHNKEPHHGDHQYGDIEFALIHLLPNAKVSKNMPEQVVVCDGPGDFPKSE